MLAKPICKRCVLEDVDDPEDFEFRWAGGMVLCPYARSTVRVKKQPPEDCPYITEHTVCQNVPIDYNNYDIDEVFARMAEEKENK